MNGIEPMTPVLSAQCSTVELHQYNIQKRLGSDGSLFGSFSQASSHPFLDFPKINLAGSDADSFI